MSTSHRDLPPTTASPSTLERAESAVAVATAAMSEHVDPARLDAARHDLNQSLSEAPDDLRLLFFAFQFHFRTGDLRAPNRSLAVASVSPNRTPETQQERCATSH